MGTAHLFSLGEEGRFLAEILEGSALGRRRRGHGAAVFGRRVPVDGAVATVDGRRRRAAADAAVAVDGPTIGAVRATN